VAIVVGLDGSEQSAAALRWSVKECRLRGSPLVAVHVWQSPYLLGLRDPALGWPYFDPAVIDRDHLEELARDQLTRAVAPARGSGVELQELLVEGNPAEALIELSAGAEMLVLGSRGHTALSGLLLGSVSHACATHATCPVVVIRGASDPVATSGQAGAEALDAAASGPASAAAGG
jgi:nucleotide-binding universal stress UspA family protein